jgi:hypothetical protein
MGNKLFLNGVLGFFPVLTQMPVGMAWTGGFLMLLLLRSPFVRKADDRLQLLASVELLLLLTCAWVLYYTRSQTFDNFVDVVGAPALCAILFFTSLTRTPLVCLDRQCPSF